MLHLQFKHMPNKCMFQSYCTKAYVMLFIYTKQKHTNKSYSNSL